MRLLHARIDSRANFHRCVVTRYRNRFYNGGKITAVNGVYRQSSVGGDDETFNDLCRIKISDVFRRCNGNANCSWLLRYREDAVRARSRGGVFGATARIIRIHYRARGDRGFKDQNGVRTQLLNGTINTQSRSNSGTPRKAIVRVGCTPPSSFFRSRTIYLVLMRMVIRRDKGRIIYKNGNIGITHGIRICLLRKGRLNVSSTNDATFRTRTEAWQKFTWDRGHFLTGLIRPRYRPSKRNYFASAHFHDHSDHRRCRVTLLRFLFVGRVHEGLNCMATVILCFIAQSVRAFDRLLCLLRLCTTNCFGIQFRARSFLWVAALVF